MNFHKNNFGKKRRSSVLQTSQSHQSKKRNIQNLSFSRESTELFSNQDNFLPNSVDFISQREINLISPLPKFTNVEIISIERAKTYAILASKRKKDQFKEKSIQTQPINPYKRKHGQLSEWQKDRILSSYKKEINISEISKLIGTSKATISSFLSQ